jgi:hypothetical protein
MVDTITHSITQAGQSDRTDTTHVATKTIRNTVSPFEGLKDLQDHTLRRALE